MAYASRIVKNERTSTTTKREREPREKEKRQDDIELLCYAVYVSICWICFWALFQYIHVTITLHHHHHCRSHIFVYIKYSYNRLGECSHAHINTNHPKLSLPFDALPARFISIRNRSVYFLRLKCIYRFYRWLEPDECSLLVIMYVCLLTVRMIAAVTTHEHTYRRESKKKSNTNERTHFAYVHILHRICHQKC